LARAFSNSLRVGTTTGGWLDISGLSKNYLAPKFS